MTANSTIIMITLEQTIPFNQQQALHVQPTYYIQHNCHDLEEHLLEKASN